ncbi:sensor histidine kinase [Flavobacterium laiguense]|uniref:histidine kinase n=1 Tax=Flavobacterium laiguense TaxID=2169409 RepID=A0A2U1JLJ0_9FLAO|nr:histidine kinase [Flavobacterium laiguense]PWA06036.1 two-component sensor histidine kinase [Flavobacterium laiguense]
MKADLIYENDLIEIIIYTCIAFLSMVLVLILFFYFSRKKIIQKEFEKKDLEIHHHKELLRAGIISQEAERKRIAQDLHDDISSKLNIVSLNSHLLMTPNLTVQEIAEITGNIINLTGKALKNSREIAHGLLPAVLDKFGLHAGVEELCQEFNSSKSVNVSYQNQVQFDDLDKDKHLHVFRILQELMNNSLRHGKARNISIVFVEENGMKECCYTDDGCGFDSKDKKNQHGLGMKNIESRVGFLEGTLNINAKVNKGVEVIFSF